MDYDENDLPKNFSVVTGTPRLASDVNSAPFSMSVDTKPVDIGNRVAATPTPCHHTEAQLTFEEKKFLLAVERGDLATVRRTLEKAKETGYININCVDPLGRSALLMAIDNENLEMVEMLIENRVETKDALLHAISEEYVEAVEVLLDHEEQIHKPCEPHSWEAIDPDAATFTPDITPLILAAHRDNYEIIKLLLDRGSTLPVPHDVRCGCNECVTSRREDSLRHSRSRINAYRALASPSLIALSSKDPILTAFELSWELQRLSFLEHEFKTEYLELRKQCQDFGTALLDHTRSSYELEILLNHDPTGPAFEHGERMHLNRLKLAIKYRQKKFVAHSNVQQLLASIWYEGLPGFRRKNIVLQTLQILWIGLLFPFYSIIYIFLPHSKLGQTLRKPFIKFICHSASYVTFLFLLILASQRIESLFSDWGANPFSTTVDAVNSTNGSTAPELPKYDMLNNRGSMPTFVEWMIFAWVMGLIWAEIKPLWEDGFYSYINDMWNIIDFITNSLYVATIALRVVAYYQVKKELAEGKDSAKLGREQWDDWDPMLISEGLFSAANIFSSLKLVYIFSVNPYLGPLQISLGRMVIDIIKFFFVYSLVLFAFACGTNQLLWYYADLDKRKCNEALRDREETKSESDACYRWRRFANLFESTQTLFWAAFGLVDLNNFELTGIKSYTRFWGLLMFGSYSVINVVVLLNLLIAMMNHSYQLISERTDTEWKFARSKLWMSYFEEGGTVPPPFNIIPTPKTVYYLCRWFGRKICGRSRAAKKEFIRTIRKKARQASERDFRYQSMMRNLVRRYITQEQRKADNQGVTEDDVNEIKQDISSFRYELIEILKNSGMNTSFAQDQPQGPGGKKGRQRERRLMKGFKIVPAAEGFPTGDAALALGAAGEMAMGLGPGSSLPLSASLVHSPSPIGRLRRAAKLANTKQPSSTSSRRRWGTLVDAAKSVRHTLGRSISQDSFGSQCSLSFQGVGGGPGAAGVAFSSTDASGGSLSLTSLPAGSTSIESTSRPPGTLRSRFAFMHHAAAKLRSPSFEESKRSAKARRNLYGGKIHTGSLKNFEKRSACSPVFSSQRTSAGKIVHKAEPVSTTSGTVSPRVVAAPHEHRLRRLRLFRYNHHRHTPPEKEPSPPPQPKPSSPSQQNSQSGSFETHKVYQRSPMTLRPDLGAALTPIPSQPSSSARSSPEGTPPASPTRTDTTYSGDYLGVESSSVYAVSGLSGQQTNVAASKPSNGSAILSKLPGIQPIGKHVPGGWL